MTKRRRNAIGWCFQGQRRWRIASLVAALLTPVSAAAGFTTINAFGQQIALPSTTPVGTVVGRHFISPGQACGAPTCKLASVTLWDDGGRVPSLGPIIPTNVSGISTRLLINGQAVSGGNLPSVLEVSAIEIQLVRDARTFIEGSLMSNAAPGYFSLCAEPTSDGSWPGYSCSLGRHGQFASVDLRGTIKPIKGTCSTPDQTIALPPAVAPGFRGVGTATGTTAFQLRLNNCPAGFYRVGYSFTPVSGTVANFPGTLAPLSGSTATGVAIRLADQRGVPVAFDRSMAVTDYAQSTGGSFAIPLSASYVQTKPVVTVGTIRGAVSVLIDYQ